MILENNFPEVFRIFKANSNLLFTKIESVQSIWGLLARNILVNELLLKRKKKIFHRKCI